MARTDRNLSYMKETFGTTSLVTDYTQPKNDTLSIQDVIEQLRIIRDAVSEEEIQEILTKSLDPEENYELYILHKIGMRACAMLTLTLLENEPTLH
jgi:hypothetical protein